MLRCGNQPRPVALQATVLAVNLMLALAMLGVNACMLHTLRDRKQRYYGVGPPEPWFTGNSDDWTYVAGYRWYNIQLKWEPVVLANIVYGAIVVAYLLSYAITRAHKPDNGWTSVRSDLALMGLLFAVGIPAAGVYNLVRWPFTSIANIGTPYVEHSLYHQRVCADLRSLCGVNRASLALTWPIAILFLALWIGELVYVLKSHGGHPAWKHGLPFLAAVPPHRRGDPATYGVVEMYDSEEAGDLAEGDDSLDPHPFARVGYVGQGDAPPLYSQAAGPLESRSRPPEPLPPFPSDARWAEHKAQVIASPVLEKTGGPSAPGQV